MELVLTIAIVIFMLAMPPLVPAWTAGATLIVVTLEVLCLAVVVAIWSRRWAEPALRLAAGIVFVIFLLAAADQLRAAIANAQPIIAGKTPVVGLFVIGVPCAVFAFRGFATGGHPAERDDPGAADDLDDELDDEWGDERDA